MHSYSHAIVPVLTLISQGPHVNIPVHQIPNLCLGKWGTHNMIRVLLPGLYMKDRKKSSLDQSEYKSFYELGLRPMIKALCPDVSDEWMPTYNSEMFHAQGKRGMFSFQSKTLAKWLVPHIGDKLRCSLTAKGVNWGAGLIFLLQIKGVKASNGHNPSAAAASMSLNEFLVDNSLSADAILQGNWFVDVGLEISSQLENCVTW